MPFHETHVAVQILVHSYERSCVIAEEESERCTDNDATPCLSIIPSWRHSCCNSIMDSLYFCVCVYSAEALDSLNLSLYVLDVDISDQHYSVVICMRHCAVPSCSGLVFDLALIVPGLRFVARPIWSL